MTFEAAAARALAARARRLGTPAGAHVAA
jgi:hypothetical protein